MSGSDLQKRFRQATLERPGKPLFTNHKYFNRSKIIWLAGPGSIKDLGKL